MPFKLGWQWCITGARESDGDDPLLSKVGKPTSERKHGTFTGCARKQSRGTTESGKRVTRDYVSKPTGIIRSWDMRLNRIQDVKDMRTITILVGLLHQERLLG